MPSLIPLSVATEIYNAAAGPATGSAFAAPSQAILISWQVIYGVAPGSITCNLQASMDGTNWATIDTTTSTASGTVRITSIAAKFLRINISAMVGGTTVQVLAVAGGLGAGKELFGGNALLAAQTTAVATTAVVTEEDFFALTLNARSFVTTGRSIRIRAFGKTAATATTKTVRIRFGGDAFVVFGSVINNIDWTAEYIIARRAFSSFIRRGNTLLNGVSPVTSVQPASIDETNPILIRVTGQNGTANANDIVCDSVIVDSLPGIAGAV